MVFFERTYAVLLVTASESFRSALLPHLPSCEFHPITTVKSVGEARRRCNEQSYDMIIINSPLPDGGEERLAIDLCTATDAGVLLFVKQEQYELTLQKVREHGVLTAGKPTSTAVLRQCIHALTATRERLRQVRTQQQSVEEKIQEIRLVNRAKWLLIQREFRTEEEAHRIIQVRAMEQRTSRSKIAQEIIAQYE